MERRQSTTARRIIVAALTWLVALLIVEAGVRAIHPEAGRPISEGSSTRNMPGVPSSRSQYGWLNGAVGGSVSVSSRIEGRLGERLTAEVEVNSSLMAG